MSSSLERPDEYRKTRGVPASLGIAARLFWILGGNAILGYLAVFIARTSSVVSWFDLAYWLVVASLVAVRYGDVKFLNGTTGDGAPATLFHWRRYSVALSVISAAVWFAAHAFSHVLAG